MTLVLALSGIGGAFAAITPLDFTLNSTPAASLVLDGTWMIAQDDGNVGKGAKWFAGGPPETAIACEVPNPLQRTFPGYHGVVWYWRTFDAAKLLQFDDLRVHFQGADYFAEVWLNGVYLGSNESALLPFAFDAKRAVKATGNQLVVRIIDASDRKAVDGFELPHVPGGRQGDDPFAPGWAHYNYGGLLLPVSFQAFERPWIGDAFIRPEIKAGSISVDLRLQGQIAPSRWTAKIRPAFPRRGSAIVTRSVMIAPNQDGLAVMTLSIPHAQLWTLERPYLYELELTPEAGHGTTWRGTFGMREVGIVQGRIALNGKPLLQRSFLYNQIWPVTTGVPSDDLARRDIELAKGANANMLRCFSKTAVPATVEAADEIGMLLQIETLATWNMKAGPEENERLRNVTLRSALLYRNHPSILWWNILNENYLQTQKRDPDNAMRFGPYALQTILPQLHALDPTRPALSDDPIWTELPNVWEPGQSQPTLPTMQDHYYQHSSLENHEISWQRVRERPWGQPPSSDAPYLAITEWGENSAPDWTKLMAAFSHSGLRPDEEEYRVYRLLLAMNLHHYEESGIKDLGFPTFDSVENANRVALVERYREYFTLFWGNPHSAGQGMTSLEDSSYEMSGVVDFWRHPKPLVYETIKELNRPLQINLWLRPSCIYSGDQLTFDATLVNEGGILPPHDYDVRARLLDATGAAVFSQFYRRRISGDLIDYLLTETIPLAASPGEYRLELQMSDHKTVVTASRPVSVFRRNTGTLPSSGAVRVWESGDKLHSWLQQRGIEAQTANASLSLPGDLLIVADSPVAGSDIAAIEQAVRQGAKAIILQPNELFKAVVRNPDQAPPKGDPYFAPNKTWQIETDTWKAQLQSNFSWWGKPGGWGYSRTALALKSPFLAGLPQAVPLEAQAAYQRIAPAFTWIVRGAPDDATVQRGVVESSLHVDTPYTSDLIALPLGEGAIVLTTLRLYENLGIDPAADLILANILKTTATMPLSHTPPSAK